MPLSWRLLSQMVAVSKSKWRRLGTLISIPKHTLHLSEVSNAQITLKKPFLAPFGLGGSHTPRRFFFKNINLSNSIAPASSLTRVILKHYVLGCYDLLSIFKCFCPQRLETLVRSLHFSTLCQVNRSGIKDEKTKVSGIFNFQAMAVKWENRFRANPGAQTLINTAI